MFFKLYKWYQIAQGITYQGKDFNGDQSSLYSFVRKENDQKWQAEITQDPLTATIFGVVSEQKFTYRKRIRRGKSDLKDKDEGRRKYHVDKKYVQVVLDDLKQEIIQEIKQLFPSVVKHNNNNNNDNNNKNNNNGIINNNNNNNNFNKNGNPVTLKYRVGIWQGIVVSHGQEELFSLGWQPSWRWCLDKNTGGSAT